VFFLFKHIERICEDKNDLRAKFEEYCLDITGGIFQREILRSAFFQNSSLPYNDDNKMSSMSSSLFFFQIKITILALCHRLACNIKVFYHFKPQV
jgi:hypothetical protein